MTGALAEHQRSPGGVWAALVAAALLLAVWVVWRVPLSPLALWRADVLLATADPAFAGAHLEAAGRYNPLASVRVEALRRCASVWQQAVGDELRARACLTLLAEDPGADAATRAWAFERVASSLDGLAGAAAEAAAAWGQAYELARKDPAAPDRLARQAMALQRAGDAEDALEVWRKLGLRYPDRKASAKLAQGDLLLGLGASRQACEVYDDALRSSPSPDVEALATRGLQVCTTRQENLQRALAVTRQDDLPEALRARIAEEGTAGGRD